MPDHPTADDTGAAPRAPRLHAANTTFPVRDGQLVVGGVPLSTLAERVGRTPFYAYDRAALRQRVAQLRTALPPAIRLHYAMKANPMPALVGLLAGLVDGVEVASAGEMATALDAGVAAPDIGLAGPGKTDRVLRQAVAAGVLVQVESLRELPVLGEAARALGLPARVALRLNPDFELKGSGVKDGGLPRQFGLEPEDVPAAYAAIRAEGLQFEGFQVWAATPSLRAAAVADALRRAVALVIRVADGAPAPVRRLCLGGGFAIPTFPGEQALDLAPVSQALTELLSQAATALPQATLVLELGRYLVGEAGVYVCRIVDRKVSAGQVFLVTDGGLHHHLAASGNFGQVVRKNYPVLIGNRLAPDLPREPVSVVGPLCTPLDLLADAMPLPVAGIGDLAVVLQSGAYGATVSPQAFLGHPACAEVLV